MGTNLFYCHLFSDRFGNDKPGAADEEADCNFCPVSLADSRSIGVYSCAMNSKYRSLRQAVFNKPQLAFPEMKTRGFYIICPPLRQGNARQRVQLEVGLKRNRECPWERQRLAGNALRIKATAILYFCRREAGAPRNKPA
jgi:hypothetical protein